MASLPDSADQLSNLSAFTVASIARVFLIYIIGGLQASGIGRYYKHSAKIIRFVRLGCTNRPFYHIVVMERRKNQHQPVIEQVGTYDPMPNKQNERLVSFNFERIRYWLGCGAHLSTPAAELLGIAGFLPIHPRTYMTAWRNRQRSASEENQEKDAVVT